MSETPETNTVVKKEEDQPDFEGFRKFATDEDAWQLVVETDDMRITKRTVEGVSGFTQRGVTVINAPVAHVLEMIKRVDLRPKWDKMVATGEVLQTVNDLHLVVRFATERQLLVAARDFIVDVRGQINDDGSVIILANSPADHEKVYPVKDGVVRGIATNSGYILEPVPDSDPQKTKITFLTQRLYIFFSLFSPVSHSPAVDPGGWIPASVLTLTVSKDKMCLPEFKKLCEEPVAAK